MYQTINSYHDTGLYQDHQSSDSPTKSADKKQNWCCLLSMLRIGRALGSDGLALGTMGSVRNRRELVTHLDSPEMLYSWPGIYQTYDNLWRMSGNLGCACIWNTMSYARHMPGICQSSSQRQSLRLDRAATTLRPLHGPPDPGWPGRAGCPVNTRRLDGCPVECRVLR
jgi:hypothetical protein